MKLHLPKTLLAAVFATMALVPATWAGEWGDFDGGEKNIYYATAEGNDDLDFTTGDQSTLTTLYIAPASGVQTATIGSITMTKGTGNNAQSDLYINGANEANFTALTINSLTVKDSTASSDASYSTNLRVGENQNVVLNSLTGAIDLHVHNTGSMVLTGTNSSGRVNVESGQLLIQNTGVSLHTLDIGMGGNSTGNVLIKASAGLQIDTLWNNTNAETTVELENGATFKVGSLTLKGTSDASNASISRTTNGSGGQYTTTNNGYTITNGQIQITENNATVNNKLSGVEILHDTNTTLTVSNAENIISRAAVSNGTLNLQAKTVAQVDITAGTLNLNGSGANGTAASVTDINLGYQTAANQAGSGTGVVNINNSTKITGLVTAWSGDLKINTQGVTINEINAGKDSYARGGVLVKENADLTLAKYTNHKNNTKGISLENNATLTIGGLTLKGLSNETNSQALLKRRRDVFGGSYSLANTDYDIENGEMKLSNGGTVANKLINVSIVHDSDNELSTTHQDSTIKEATVSNGTLKLNAASADTINVNGGALELNSTATNGMSVGSLNIANGTNVGGTGAVTVTNRLSVSSELAFSLNGALTLGENVSYDLTGLNISSEKTSYTLGSAASINFAEGVQAIDITGFNGYSAKLAIKDSIADSQVASVAEGATSQYLVLELTPVQSPALTEITVSDVVGYADGTLTLKTDLGANDTLTSETLDVLIGTEAWKEALAMDLGELIQVQLQDALGNAIDLSGLQAVTLNGVTAVAPIVGPTAGGVAGSYITAYIPEPTTSTLSMLALAALAVRRRRR